MFLTTCNFHVFVTKVSKMLHFLYHTVRKTFKTSKKKCVSDSKHKMTTQKGFFSMFSRHLSQNVVTDISCYTPAPDWKHFLFNNGKGVLYQQTRQLYCLQYIVIMQKINI